MDIVGNTKIKDLRFRKRVVGPNGFSVVDIFFEHHRRTKLLGLIATLLQFLFVFVIALGHTTILLPIPILSLAYLVAFSDKISLESLLVDQYYDHRTLRIRNALIGDLPFHSRHPWHRDWSPSDWRLMEEAAERLYREVLTMTEFERGLFARIESKVDFSKYDIYIIEKLLRYDDVVRHAWSNSDGKPIFDDMLIDMVFFEPVNIHSIVKTLVNFGAKRAINSQRLSIEQKLKYRQKPFICSELAHKNRQLF